MIYLKITSECMEMRARFTDKIWTVLWHQCRCFSCTPVFVIGVNYWQLSNYIFCKLASSHNGPILTLILKYMYWKVCVGAQPTGYIEIYSVTIATVIPLIDCHFSLYGFKMHTLNNLRDICNDSIHLFTLSNNINSTTRSTASLG